MHDLLLRLRCCPANGESAKRGSAGSSKNRGTYENARALEILSKGFPALSLSKVICDLLRDMVCIFSRPTHLMNWTRMTGGTPLELTGDDVFDTFLQVNFRTRAL